MLLHMVAWVFLEGRDIVPGGCYIHPSDALLLSKLLALHFTVIVVCGVRSQYKSSVQKLSATDYTLTVVVGIFDGS